MDIPVESGRANLGRYASAGLGVGLIATGVSIALFLSNDPVMAQGYLFAWTFLMMFTLGFFGLTMLHHALRGKWGLPILRILEAGASVYTLGLMAILFIPVLVGVWNGHSPLYSWTDINTVAADPVLKFKSGYLNPEFFTVRWAGFFLIWIWLAWMMRKSTLKQDATGEVREEQKRSARGAVGLVFFFLSATFAVTDWIMSLEPHWSSTMYGLWWCVQAGWAALAVVLLIVCSNRNREPYKGKVNPGLTRDLGNLGLTLTMLWGYTSISQYLIIWSGNLPEYTKYFVNRSNGNWNAAGFILIIGQFFVPFFALITPRIKAVPASLMKVAAWVLLMRLIEGYYLVMPAFGNRVTPMPHWQDIVALAGVAGLWVWAFSAAVKGADLMPSYDPRLTEKEAHAH